MNLAVLLENQEIGEKGRRITSYMMKSMEGVKNLDSNTDESLGIWRAVCIESKLWNWGDPNRYRKVKRKHISLEGEIVDYRKGVGGEHSIDDM